MNNLDSNPQDGTEQIDAPEILDEEEAQEANPNDEEQEAQPEAESEDEDEEGESEEVEGEGEDDAKASDAIEIDGKSYTLDEVKAGFMLQADYTRKTQAIAEERRTFEAESGAAVERLAQQDANARQQLEFAHAVIAAIMPPDPDASLIDTDPAGFMRAKEARQQVENALRELSHRARGFEQQQQQLSHQQTEKALSQEWDIVKQRLPELATKEGAEKFRSKAIEIGKSAWGLEPFEVDSIRSHKELLILRDAIAYREAKAKKLEAVEKVRSSPKIAKPGARTGNNPSLKDHLRQLGREKGPEVALARAFSLMDK